MKSDLKQYFFQMVRVDSESGEEKKFLQFISQLFGQILEAKSQYDDFGNLIMKIKPKNSLNKESLLFCCHGDTVKPGKGIDPIEKNGKIYSRGNTILGADDKAGIAEILVAIANADQYPPIELVVTRQEEVGLTGSSHLDGHLVSAKQGYVLDSESLEDIVIGGPSRMKIIVDIKGKAAHAVEPQNGISAIEIAAQSISVLQTGWIDQETTVNIGLIKGGQVLNAVPEKAEIQIECRSQNHQKCLDHSQLIKHTFETVAKARQAQAIVKMDLDLKASRISEKHEVVQIAQKAIQFYGLQPKTIVICGGTDAAYLNQKGIATAVLGVGGKLPHSMDEHIFLKDMEKATKILIKILEYYS